MKHDVEKVVAVQPNERTTNGVALNHLRYPPTRAELGLPSGCIDRFQRWEKKERTTTPTKARMLMRCLFIPHLVDGGHLLQELGQARAEPHVVV